MDSYKDFDKVAITFINVLTVRYAQAETVGFVKRTNFSLAVLLRCQTCSHTSIYSDLQLFTDSFNDLQDKNIDLKRFS